MLHHNFKKGTPVLIILKSGEKIIDKFLDFKAKYFICEGGKYSFADIRSTGAYKEPGKKQREEDIRDLAIDDCICSAENIEVDED